MKNPLIQDENNKNIIYKPRLALSEIKLDHVLPAVEFYITRLEGWLNGLDKDQAYLQLQEVLNLSLDSKISKLASDNLSNNLSNNLFNSLFDRLIVPVQTLSHDLDACWGQVSHLYSVQFDDSWHSVYEQALALLSDFSTKFSQDKRHYQLYLDLYDYSKLCKLYDLDKEPDQDKIKLLELNLEDFELMGVGLSGAKKTKFQKIAKKLSILSNDFDNNITNNTDAWLYEVADNTDLLGLPESLIAAAKLKAEKLSKATKLTNKDAGWVFDLQFPTYWVVMTKSKSAKMRADFYKAYVTRASSEGEFAPKWNNDKLISNILHNRYELVNLLGFDNYTQYALKQRMCSNSKQVFDFLSELADIVTPIAKQQMQQLVEFAESKGLSKLKCSDVLYYSQKMKQESFGVDEESLRVYFPISKVLNGLFKIFSKFFNFKVDLFDINNIENKLSSDPGYDRVDLKNIFYHPDVLGVQVTRTDKTKAYLILDLFSRTAKRSGAWMHDVFSRIKVASEDKAESVDKVKSVDKFESVDKAKSVDKTKDVSKKSNLTLEPIAAITCNFQPVLPGQNQALLTHDDVVTLFHETGHALQHVLTKVDYLSVSGINHVPWDAVEVCSQFLENYCWDKNSIALLSEHVETKKPLPKDVLGKLIKAKNFQSALSLSRQIQFAMFDMLIHVSSQAYDYNEVAKVLAKVRKEYGVYDFEVYDRFQNSFSHIFAGGYAAGYYSYLWAQMIASDLFSRFEDNGLFDKASALALKTGFYERGGASSPVDLFSEFCSRSPETRYFLKHYDLYIS